MLSGSGWVVITAGHLSFQTPITLTFRRWDTDADTHARSSQLHNPQRVLRGKHMLKHYGGKWIHPPPPSYMHLTSHTWAVQVGRLIFAFKSGSNSWLGVDCSLVQCQRQSLWTTSPPAPERISQTSPRPVWFCTSFTSWDIPLQATNPIKTLHRNSMCDRDKEKRDRQRDIARVITSFVLEDVALSVAAKKKKSPSASTLKLNWSSKTAIRFTCQRANREWARAPISFVSIRSLRLPDCLCWCCSHCLAGIYTCILQAAEQSLFLLSGVFFHRVITVSG